MKKIIGTWVLAGLLCFGCGTSAYANQVTDIESNEITLNFAAISDINYDFTINNKGKAYYAIDVSTRNADKIKVYMELQQKDGTRWSKVKGKTFTGYDLEESFDDYCYVDDISDTYRVYYRTTIYYGDGKSEQATKYCYE